MHGACFLACSNISRTRDAPTPTNISTKSEPEIEKKGTSASPAIARPSNVLPVPGGPTNKIPLGILPPKRVNLVGSRKNSITSVTSCLASSQPATSSKVTRSLCSVSNLALDLPKPMAPPLPPPCIWRIKKIHTPIKSSIGNHEIKIVRNIDSSRCDAFTSTLLSIKRCTKPGSSGNSSSKRVILPDISR